VPITLTQIVAAHQLYCQLTGQSLRLGFGRERQWFDWLRAGFTPEDLRRVIGYLQREVREGRRNVGALKLSNLLQPDRFEEDLNIRRIRLDPLPRHSTPAPAPAPLSAQERERRRLHALQEIRQIKQSLREIGPTSPRVRPNHEPNCDPQSVQHGSI
jgi:hypothetical protein